jgi:four helix bundle protein
MESQNASYRELVVWQRAMQLATEVYRATKSFPRDEIFGLTSQMRRAAVSVPSNTAEGKGRYSPKDLTHFLYQARGSVLELQTQITIARDLIYLDVELSNKLETLADEVGRLLNGLLHHFKTQVSPTPAKAT